MPRTEQHYIKLPPAKLSSKQLQEIDEALPSHFKGALSWIVGAGNIRVEEDELGNLIQTIQTTQGITEFQLWVEMGTITLELTCEEEGSYLRYSCSPDKLRELHGLARNIEGIFREHRLRGWRIPFSTKLILELGQQPMPRLKLSSSRIWENVIANRLSYLSILMISLVVGFLIGKFT